ncbi:MULTISPECIES: DUF6730 family protein [Maribacter]|uniref:Uncharacterized protein n=2 Tax=Maribacter TaxID=252356 RepID=A0A5R8MBV8_9FLAO|nr:MULTISPECIES: DUF6730 family protein [Maribacter]KAA2219033.1 hypothetical protein F0361_05320 [Maribacter flavus]TLF46259.1 hypothetical protein FEK29_00330 [Maribacter aurantiacus]
MTKLDEIMEVLTQEISGFTNSIAKLEELSEKLKNLKLETDTSRLESRINDFLRWQRSSVESYENRMEEVLKTIEKSRWAPKWENALLYIAISFNAMAFAYLGYYFINYELKVRDSIKMAREEGHGNARDYFREHPIILKDFEKWSKKRDSIPNRE